MRWYRFHASQVMSSLCIYPGAKTTGQKLVLAKTWSGVDTNREHCFSDKVFMQVIGLMEISVPTSAEHPHSAGHVLWQPSERQTADSTHPAAVLPSHSTLSDDSCRKLTWNPEKHTAASIPKVKTAKGNSTASGTIRIKLFRKRRTYVQVT